MIMGKINTGRVLLGGVVAGLIVNVGEFILNVPVAGEEFDAAMRELGKEPVAASAITIFVILGFLLGIVGVWLYAAMRPRFGPGPRTAATAGLTLWALAYLFPTLGMMVMDLFPFDMMLLSLVWGLVETQIALQAGAWFYQEAAAAQPAPEFVAAGH
ncbi:MAG: hypothetical protein HY703_04540 [Gemmatimonadetes bacterium]|nr:hypothetical protein [Gemmatimonadota bacterium]